MITEFGKDARQWTKRRWSDVDSGETFVIATRGDVGGEGVARVQSYADVLARCRTHPKPKSIAVGDGDNGRRAVGVLGRRPVTARDVVGIGKEADRLEEVQSGLVHALDDVLQVFAHPGFDERRSVIVPTLRRIPARWLAEQTGLALSTVKAARNGHAVPHVRNCDKLVRTANDFPIDGLIR